MCRLVAGQSVETPSASTGGVKRSAHPRLAKRRFVEERQDGDNCEVLSGGPIRPTVRGGDRWAQTHGLFRQPHLRLSTLLTAGGSTSKTPRTNSTAGSSAAGATSST